MLLAQLRRKLILSMQKFFNEPYMYIRISLIIHSNSLVMNLWCGALAVAVTMPTVYVRVHTLTDKHLVLERVGAYTVLHPAVVGPRITHSY